MLMRWLADLNFPMWQAVLVPTVGVAMAGFTVFVVRRRQHRQLATWPLADPPTLGSGPMGTASASALGLRQPPPPERRSSLRRRGNPVAVLVANAQAASKPWDGWVLDRSSGGLRLAVPRAIAVGTLLKVRTTHDPDCAPWVQLCVKRCRQRDDVWVLGCQFVQMPPVNVLLLFG